MLEFRNPIPVLTDMGGGYAIYVRDGGTLRMIFGQLQWRMAEAFCTLEVIK